MKVFGYKTVMTYTDSKGEKFNQHDYIFQDVNLNWLTSKEESEKAEQKLKEAKIKWPEPISSVMVDTKDIKELELTDPENLIESLQQVTEFTYVEKI